MLSMDDCMFKKISSNNLQSEVVPGSEDLGSLSSQELFCLECFIQPWEKILISSWISYRLSSFGILLSKGISPESHHSGREKNIDIQAQSIEISQLRNIITVRSCLADRF